MDHDENKSILSYYISGLLIPSGVDELRPPPPPSQRRDTSSVDMISLPKTTYGKSTTTVSSTAKNNRDIHQRTVEFDTERVIPWVVDEWTIAEERDAATVLEEMTEQCRITDHDYKTKKFRINDTVAWDRFYQSHQSNFFKDRHYFVKEFPQEFTASSGEGNDDVALFNIIDHDIATSDVIATNNGSMSTLAVAARTISNPEHRCLVEIGCGVGNAMLPLLGSDRCTDDDIPNDAATNETVARPSIQWTAYGFDLSSTAIGILRNDVRYQKALQLNRTYCDVCDISIPNVLPSYVQNVANVTSLIFCLSAIHPTKHSIVLQNVVATLQPGRGILIFRDYGRYDLAQIKLGTQRAKLLDADNFYRKHDGTKCYYFTIQDMEQLVQQQNGALEIVELRYIRRKYINRSMQCERRRVWVQGRFRRTTQGNDFNQSGHDNNHTIGIVEL